MSCHSVHPLLSQTGRVATFSLVAALPFSMEGVLFSSCHKVRTYKEYHSVCPSSELGLPPTPQPQASVPPPPCFWGEGNTRWRERGWESPNSDTGHTLWYSLYVRTLCQRVSTLIPWRTDRSKYGLITFIFRQRQLNFPC
jgi:hypothetical protein